MAKHPFRFNRSCVSLCCSAGLLSLLSACQLLYDSRQGVERQNCYKQPNVEDFRECVNRPRASYSQYTKERESLSPREAEPNFSAVKKTPTCVRDGGSTNQACTE